MAYIGKTPITGNFVKLDAISVVNGQAAYTMNNGGSAFTDYENVNQFLVSLNGILQAPTDSFSVSGSTLTFASNLATGDVIDFVIVLGNTLDIGTPSDATVTQAKTNFVSTSSAAGLQIKGDGTTDGTLQLNCSQNSHGVKIASPAHSAGQSYTLTLPTGNVTADKILKVASITGSGTTAVGQLSFADAGGGAFEKISTTDLGDGSTASVEYNTLSTDYVDFRVVVTGLETVTHQALFSVRVKRAGESSFDSGSSDYLYANHGYRTDGEFAAGDGGDPQIRLHSANIASQSGVDGASNNFIIDIFNPHDTWNKKFIGVQAFFTEGDYGRAAAQQGAGYRNSKEAIIGLEFFMSSGNMSRGVFTLYGRKQ
jgi:hypothetical protein